jgi:hypothetical protein
VRCVVSRPALGLEDAENPAVFLYKIPYPTTRGHKRALGEDSDPVFRLLARVCADLGQRLIGSASNVGVASVTVSRLVARLSSS